ncbi:MAG TPA: cache domain-containing protein, partial [Clostridia bacterium]|nr:cache domain-containing protein [Clostridia bacterium]
MRYLISQFEDMSLRTKMFIFYAAVLLASLSVFAILTIRISSEGIVEKATKNAERELSLINNSLLNLTQNAEGYVSILTTDNRLQNQLERVKTDKEDSLDNIETVKTLSTAISNVVKPNTYISAASIISSKHKLFDIGFVDNSSIYPVISTKVTNLVAQNKTPIWTGLIKIKYKFFVGDDNVFAIAKTIIGMDTGHNLGIAILYLKEKDIASIYMDNMVNQDVKFFILDDQRKIISTQDKDELYRKFDEKRYLGDYKLEEVSNVKSLIRNIGGSKELITVQDFKKLNWKIVSVIPLKEITYEKKGMTKLIVIFGVTCLICAFAASYLLSYTPCLIILIVNPFL